MHPLPLYGTPFASYITLHDRCVMLPGHYIVSHRRAWPLRSVAGPLRGPSQTVAGSLQDRYITLHDRYIALHSGCTALHDRYITLVVCRGQPEPTAHFPGGLGGR